MKILPARVSSKPQYVFHPRRALRRAHTALTGPPEGDGVETAHLPWDLELDVHPADAIGYSIVVGGVFDPCVSESMYRLIDPGEVVFDVGANIGYLTSLAAARAGAGGKVVAFEPHPEVFALLEANAAKWKGRREIAPVELHQCALSDHSGTGELATGALFHANMGLAAVHSSGEATPDGELVSVALKRLDDIAGEEAIGLLKIDVEGHEAAVLKGAPALLEAGRARDIIFEDHGDYPSEATELLERSGYTLISLANDLFGLTLSAPRDRGPTAAWPGPSYLATRDPERATARLRPRGWRLKGIGPGWNR